MTFQFKTNINCGGCIAKVTPFLDAEAKISSWEVDTENPDKILTVASDELSKGEIIEIVHAAGFEAREKKKKFGLF